MGGCETFKWSVGVQSTRLGVRMQLRHRMCVHGAAAAGARQWETQGALRRQGWAAAPHLSVLWRSRASCSAGASTAALSGGSCTASTAAACAASWVLA